MRERKRAGLPLSVGNAPIGVRITVALVFVVTAALCIAGGVAIAGDRAARVVAIVFVVPLGLIGLLAAAFVIAPHSRYGVWLDHFVPRLREPHTAIAVVTVLWALAFLLTA